MNRLNCKRMVSGMALFLLSALLLTAAWAQGRHSRLASRLVRFHILAESDSEEDQSRKLIARDAVLSRLAPALEGAESREEAEAILRELLPALEETAAEAAGAPARIALGREFYPTRDYGSFALPAGNYTSLRITLGEGRGHNWWCVVYPPLCNAASEEQVAAAAALGARNERLISGDGERVFRFRIVELWGEVRHALEEGK